jgi:tetratricopeptide (TPR) repeat protein
MRMLRPRSTLLIPAGALLIVGLFALAGSLSKLAQAQGDSGFDAVSSNATTAREAGRIEEAIRDYRASLNLRPDWDEGWWYLGTLSYDVDHFQEAIPALKHFTDVHSEVGAAWAFLGLSEFEIGDHHSAFDHLQQAQRLGFADDPDVEKVAIYHLGLLMNLQGQFEKSAPLLVGTFGKHQFQEQIKVALGMALLRIPLLPSQVDPAKDALINAAGEVATSLANQDIAASKREFQHMLKDYPGTPYLAYGYGTFLLQNGEYELAERQFRDEGLLRPQSAVPHLGLSSLYLKQERIHEAIEEARSAVALAPQSAAGYQALSQALQGAGLKEKAAAALRTSETLLERPAEFEISQASRYLAKPAEVQTGIVASGIEGTSPTGAGDASKLETSGAGFEELSRQGASARTAGHLAEAESLYRSALQLRPGWQEGWRQLGTLQYMAKHYSEAVSALQHAVALDGRQADTWTLLGLCEFETKDYGNALIHLEKGRGLGFGGNAAAVRYARYRLALLLNENGQFDRATDLLIPEARSATLSDEIQFAMGLALLRMPLLPEEVVPQQRELVQTAGKAAMLLSESRYDQAFPLFQKMLREYPDTHFLHYAYGDALAATSEYDGAQAELREETVRNPESGLAYFRLASIALRLNHPDAALASAQRAVSLSADSPDAHYLLGRSLLESGDPAGAISELEIARKLAPGSPAVHFNLARAYAKAQRPKDAQQEREEFERLNAQIARQESGRDLTRDKGHRDLGGEALVQPNSK